MVPSRIWSSFELSVFTGELSAVANDQVHEFDKAENHHFLIQTVRIPKTESPSLRKIIQIALNIGQYLAFNNKTIIKRVNINDYINKKDSNTKLSDILSTKDITKIKNILS